MGDILTPFLIAGLLAYLGDPLVNRLEKWHLSRGYAAMIIFSLMLFFVIALGLLIIPLLQTQIEILILKIPDIIAWLQNTLMPWLEKRFDIKANIDPVEIKTVVLSHWQQAGNALDKIIQALTHSTKTVLGFLINLVLIPVVTFYLLRDWPLLLNKMKNLVPRQYIVRITEIAAQCNEVVGAFFRGQFLVMLALGFYYTASLMILGLDLAVLIGILIALLSIVPLLGSIVGLLLGIITTIFQFHDIKHVCYLLVIFCIGHVLENMILTPLLIGNRVGLHPVAVIFAILLAGSLFGFLGILLAIPVAAVLLVLLKVFYRQYVTSQFYLK